MRTSAVSQLVAHACGLDLFDVGQHSETEGPLRISGGICFPPLCQLAACWVCASSSVVVFVAAILVAPKPPSPSFAPP